MLNLVYPSAATMKEIDADLTVRSRANRLGFQLFPVEEETTFQVRWIQKDNYYGLMAMRGIDGAPPKVQRVGENSFVYEPGVYGENVVITERELLMRSVPNRPDIPIPVTDLVTEAQMQLTQRKDDRVEANVFSLLSTGTLSIPLPGPNGVIAYKDAYTFQTITASVPWATAATATPLLNFQQAQQLQIGHGVDFGAAATAYMNQFTANLLLNNANASDFGGRRNQFGATINDLAAFNNYFAGQNLPKIQVYDQGYQPNPISGPITTPSSQFIKFIPDHTVIIVGRRPGNTPVGAFKQTLQAMQPGAAPSPGAYSFIKDYARGINAPLEVPPKLEVHEGFNGGLVMYYQNSVIVMTV